MPASQHTGPPSTESLRAPDRRRLYEQLVQRLLDYVEVTGLVAGDRLPSERDLAQALHVHHSDEIDALSKRLAAMLRDGQLVQNRRDEYCVVKLLPLVAGTVIGHRDGFGFLKPDEGGDDVFLPPRQMRTLMHGDRALVRRLLGASELLKTTSPRDTQ